MNIDIDSERRFFACERTPKVKFVINDSVKFESEDGSRRHGSVISIASLEPEVSYLVEPNSEPWGDVVVLQTALTIVE